MEISIDREQEEGARPSSCRAPERYSITINATAGGDEDQHPHPNRRLLAPAC
ncbi:hypothetical protein [Mycobacterium szulgai]|uniref:hypothetical protein n=1 Tax=Mycobacterium szulgai TaxID=1787 RepID=UPI0021F2BBCA|nr:hypothetical protein [Mycobacterium szulgai]MCV7075678.1 hypothetical protein [Mycobacterium szulgai]